MKSKTLWNLFIATSFVFAFGGATEALAQNSSALATSGMGGGASSTARLTAQMSQVQDRADAVETCGNKAKVYGPSFGGAKDGDNCVTGIHLTTSGDVGIGTTGPSAKLDVIGNIEATGSLSNISNLKIGDVGHGTGWPGITNSALGSAGEYAIIQNSSGQTLLNSASGQSIGFRIGNNQQMTLTSAGDFGVGVTSPSAKLHVNGTGRVNSTLYVGGNATFASNATVSNNVTANAFFYSSDRSLKKNIEPVTDGLNLVSNLEPVFFDWKANDKPSIGFIAQDVLEIVPAAVEETQNGTLAVDYGKLVAPLVAAVQEQQKQIKDLQAEVKALRANLNLKE